MGDVMEEQTLDVKMLTRANADGLPDTHPVVATANDIAKERSEEVFIAKRMLGRWARARRAWHNYSGEPLLDIPHGDHW